MIGEVACAFCGDRIMPSTKVRQLPKHVVGGVDCTRVACASHFEAPALPEYELAPAFLEPPLICTRQGCIAPRVPSLHHCAEHTREFAAFLNDPANFKKPSGLSDEQRRQVGSMIAGAIKGHCAERFAKIERKIAATNRLLASRVAQLFGSIKFLAGKKRTDALPQPPANPDNAPSREAAQADASPLCPGSSRDGAPSWREVSAVARGSAFCIGWRAALEYLISQIEAWRAPHHVPVSPDVRLGHDDAVSAARKLIGEARSHAPASEPVDVVKLRDEVLEEAALVLDALAKEADSQLGAIHHQGGTDEEFDEAFGSREALEAAAGYVRRKKSDALAEVSRSIDSTLSADVKTAAESERAS